MHHDRSLRWYRAHFPTQAARRRREREAGGPVITGEGSPYYLFHPHGPARAAAAVPDARIIAMLRDPVERAYSHYQQEYARGFEDADTFERALELEPGRLAGERERMLADPDYSTPRDAAPRLRRARRVRRPAGGVAGALPGRAHPGDLVRALLRRSCGRLPRRCCASSACPSPRPAAVQGLQCASRRGMADETRARLRAHFAEPNRRLEEYLGTGMGWASREPTGRSGDDRRAAGDGRARAHEGPAHGRARRLAQLHRRGRERRAPVRARRRRDARR